MAKSYVSPGVFTNEIDASFLGPGVGSIGAAIVGAASKGPAFVPVTVSNFSEYVSYFGDLDPDYILGYAARAYLKNAGTANVVRVLGPEGTSFNGTTITPGYSAESIWSINAVTGSTAVVMAVLEVTGGSSMIVTDLANDECFVRISGTNMPQATVDGFVAVTASFLSGSSNYIKKVLNTDPTKFSTYGYYLRDVYDYALKVTNGGNALYHSASHAVVTNFAFGYNSGSAPWVKSQLFGGSSEYNIFRVHTLGHGEVENGRFKVSVTNIKPSPAPTVSEFGFFDLEIRSFDDTDKNKVVVESFVNLTLDPKDPGYLPRAIGDKLWVYDVNKGKMVTFGDYDNKSKLIRIEMTTGSFPDSALPWGYRGLVKPNLTISSSAGPVASGIPDLPIVKDLKDKETQSEAQSYICWGLETVLSGNVKARLTKMSAMTGSDADFSLALVSGSSVGTLVYNTSNPVASRKAPGDTTSHTVLASDLAKFTLPIAFGYDGFDRRLADPLANESQLAATTQLGVQAIRQAVDIISDADFIDINLLAIPGIYSSKVADYALQEIQTRADAFYVMDVSGSTVNAIVQEVKGRGFDTSYASVYYPNIRVRDDVNGVAKTLPSSVAALGAIAYNDRVAYPWFAPAGLNRAGLSKDTIGFDVLSVMDQLTSTERDTLYANRINPIARFPDVPQGVIWGQKTLQLKKSALDRINVRRLLIKAKKIVASAIKFLVFEPNNPQTQTRFRQLVNPILADIQQKQGLDEFKVVMDETTNTPDLIDRNTMAGQVFLRPTRTAEFVTVDFVISKSGASFSE